ncbi:MAG: flagellar hook capping FlgD N-terminal domain-containing protein [Hydrogenophaga sp.]|nr:flagellar hook capping FlgD N-terminal domain-containing protein [Hydrogenophaga sp.]
MFTQAIDTRNLGQTVGSTTGSGANNASDPAASQDRFLKLLVAQLNNQDPLNPMDNAQMTSQMAQINTVSGIQELNATLKGMASQFGAMQAMQGTSLVGREALVSGSQLGFDGVIGKGAMRLDQNAGNVSVDVLGSAGQVIDTLNFGPLTAGQHSFNWDGSGVNPTTVSGFRVRASTDGQPVGATTFTRLTVTGSGMTNGAMSLQMQDGRTVGYDQVVSFI